MQGSYEKITTSENMPAMIRYVDASALKESSWQLNQDIPAHWHRSIEISLVMQGSVELWVQKQRQIIHENEFIFVNSGFMHQLSAAENTLPSVLIVIISYEFIKKIVPNIDDLFFDLSISQQGKDRLLAIYEAFRQYCQDPKPYDEIVIHGYLYEIIGILMKYYCIGKQENGWNVQKQKLHPHKILGYIEEHYNEELNLNRMAAMCNMSNEYFCRLFSQRFGVSFKFYLENYRLYKAYSDIINTNLSIQQIALKHGFSNVKSLISRFKKLYGTTPYQYRKINK